MGKRKPDVVKCDAIETGRFELVDKDGTARAELIMCSSGPLLRMFTEDGHERLRLEVHDGYPVVQLSSATSVRVRLEVEPGGQDGGDGVSFELYGEGKTGTLPEPALFSYVDSKGNSTFTVDFAGLNDRGDIDCHGGVKLTSGDGEDRAPRLAVWGRNCINDHVPILELPERSRDGVETDIVNDVYALVRRHAEEHGLDTKQVSDILDSADQAYSARGPEPNGSDGSRAKPGASRRRAFFLDSADEAAPAGVAEGHPLLRWVSARRVHSRNRCRGSRQFLHRNVAHRP